MSNSTFIHTLKSGARADVLINRPPLNVLNIAAMKEMLDTLNSIRSDREIRVLVVRGEGKCFSAGMDVEDHLPARVHQMFEVMHRLLESISNLEMPTIAVLHGAALGGAFEIALMMDFIYAEPDCKIGLPEIQLGVFPPVAAALYPYWGNKKLISDLLLTGRNIPASQAFDMGILNGIYPQDELIRSIDTLADVLLSRSAAALAITKRVLRKTDAEFWERLKNAEQVYLEELMNTEDAVEGLQAFIQKRKPVWKHC